MAKVLKDFRCKVTKRVYRAGEIYGGDRAEELQNLGYVEIEEGESKTKKTKKPKQKRKDSE